MKNRYVLMVAALLIGGCTQTQFDNVKYRYEYTSPEEEALSQVRQASLSSTVPFPEDSYAMERVHFFFTQILKVGSPTVSEGQVNGERYFSGASKNYSYSIRRSPAVGGYAYRVACVERGSNKVTTHSDLNARNLSRFILNGTFEKKALFP